MLRIFVKNNCCCSKWFWWAYCCWWCCSGSGSGSGGGDGGDNVDGNFVRPKLLLKIFVIENVIGAFCVCCRGDNFSIPSLFSCLMLECISDGDVLHWIEFALIEILDSVIIVTDGDVTGGAIDIFYLVVEKYICINYVFLNVCINLFFFLI